MKINKILLSAAALTLSLTSCEDYLDVDSPSAFDQQYVFSNTADAQKVLWGAYELFAQDSYTSRMSCVWHQNTDIELQGVSTNPDGSRRDIWSLQGGRLGSFSDVKKAWDESYKAIDRANQVVEGIQSSSLANTDDMQQLLGEAYCLRSFRYHLLVGFFGDIPYFREAAKGGMDLDIPKCDKNKIYSMLIQDLVNIEGKMQWAKNMSNGIERFNREFALGFAARMSMFRAGYAMTYDGTMKRADDYLDVASNDSLAVNYTNVDGVAKVARTSAEYYELAKDLCQKLINSGVRTLDSDFYQIFKNECTFVKPDAGDVLYEVGFLAANGGDVGWCIGWPVTGGSNGTTTVQVGFAANYLYLFDENDNRLQTVARVSYTSDTEQAILGPTAMATGKWNRQWLTTSPGSSSSKGTGINWPLMRYSDVYLMLAEAENAINGPSELAKEAFKTVHRRAFDAAYQSQADAYVDNNAGSAEDFFNAIVDERAREFGGECLRKFDLVRWNIYGKKLSDTKRELVNWGYYAAGDPDHIDDPECAKYANRADVIYYTNTNGTLNLVNPLYKLDDALVPEITVGADVMATDGSDYAKTNWGKSFCKVTTTVDADGLETKTYAPADFLERTWRGYVDIDLVNPTSPVPYLIAIPESKIANSVYLNNDGYGHVTE